MFLFIYSNALGCHFLSIEAKYFWSGLPNFQGKSPAGLCADFYEFSTLGNIPMLVIGAPYDHENERCLWSEFLYGPWSQVGFVVGSNHTSSTPPAVVELIKLPLLPRCIMQEVPGPCPVHTTSCSQFWGNYIQCIGKNILMLSLRRDCC